MINLDKKTDFLQTIDAAINYFNPDIIQSETDRKILELANETMKIEIDRVKKAIKEKQSAIKSLETKNTVLSSNLAFATHEISELEKDNSVKQGKIEDLIQTIESRKSYLQEAQLELDSHRRIESFTGIAEKRVGLKTARVGFGLDEEYKIEAEESEEKLERALIKIQRLGQELKRVQEMVRNCRFRLGLEEKEQAHLGNQNKRLNEVEVGGKEKETKVPALKRPTTAIVRSKIIIK